MMTANNNKKKKKKKSVRSMMMQLWENASPPLGSQGFRSHGGMVVELLVLAVVFLGRA
jgi:hypothetical protein